ncbi:MAG: hypothetical protein RLZZ69_3642, partial [Cyanobacteriota bacterium]
MSQILNPTEILTNLSSSKATGILQASDSRVNWSIYLEAGQIKCAANSVQHLMITLDHHLRSLGLQNAAAAAKSIPAPSSEQQEDSYNWLEGGRIIPSINWLVLREHLDREQAQQIFTSLSKEAIETFLWIKEGEHKWQKNQSLPQHALAARVTFENIDLLPLIQKLEQRVKGWQNFGASINSPYQCPYLTKPQELTESSAEILLKLAKFLKGLSFPSSSFLKPLFLYNMAFASVVRRIETSPLTKELLTKLDRGQSLLLNGIPRLPKGIVCSSLAQAEKKNLLVVCSTLEEAGRWAAQLEAMGWDTVNFYPTSEASPYDPFDPESETIWGQMQALIEVTKALAACSQKSKVRSSGIAIVATERSLQPHLPPKEVFQSYCLTLQSGMELTSQQLDESLVRLGYERVNLVETEGQWSRRGDIVDIFPVSAELPVRLDWFGDELEQLKEFDPATQRSLDKLEQLLLTPTSFSNIIAQSILEQGKSIESYLDEEELEALLEGNPPEGMRRFLGIAFEQPASIIDYLPENTLIAFDELEQCQAHSDRWLELAQFQWQDLNQSLPKIHTEFANCLAKTSDFNCIYLSEIAEANPRLEIANPDRVAVHNLQARPIPTTPNQFAKLASILRGKREIYSGMTLEKYQTWLVSAQPSRSASLLQEHDCPVQFVPNPLDFRAIDKAHIQTTAVAVKYSGLAELEGFILPTYRIVIVTDKEFFGQQTLATSGYIRKRRRATSKKVDLNKLRPGDYVVHKHHGLGKFLELETLVHREYLVVQYADGTLRIPADSLDMLTRFRQTGNRPPELNKMANVSWTKTKSRV